MASSGDLPGANRTLRAAMISRPGAATLQVLASWIAQLWGPQCGPHFGETSSGSGAGEYRSALYVAVLYNYQAYEAQSLRVEEARKYGALVASRVRKPHITWHCENAPARLRWGWYQETSGNMRLAISSTGAANLCHRCQRIGVVCLSHVRGGRCAGSQAQRKSVTLALTGWHDGRRGGGKNSSGQVFTYSLICPGIRCITVCRSLPGSLRRSRHLGSPILRRRGVGD